MFEGKSYEAVLKELYGFKRMGIRPALPPVKKLLRVLGSPHKKGRFIHVAGTNGKGSTVAMIAAILKNAGYKTGAFYSPHITDYRERFLINGKQITKKELMPTLQWMGKKWTTARKKDGRLPDRITFFEWSVALAFTFFAKNKVDVAVLETGMGGRFDATNVVDPLVSVITNISHEHTKFLGGTKAKIAAEKGGIIKNKRPVVLGDRSKPVREAIKKIARRKKARVYQMGEDFTVTSGGLFSSGDFQVTLRPRMQGRYQCSNAALAAQAVLLSRLPTVGSGEIVRGVASAALPGRFECVTNGREIIYDAAHNPAAFRELAVELSRQSPGGKYDILIGFLRGKNYRAVMKIIAPLTGRMFCITPDDERALPARSVCRAARDAGIRATVIKNPDGLKRIAVGKRTLLVTGSFTTLAAAKSPLHGLATSWRLLKNSYHQLKYGDKGGFKTRPY